MNFAPTTSPLRGAVAFFSGLGLFAPPATPAPAREAGLVPAVHPTLTIDKGEILVVARPMGVAVACVSGDLWITHDGDPKDVVLRAGQTYTSARKCRMLVQGLERSEVRVIH